MTDTKPHDVIDGATPLECRFNGVHPRLYLTAERLEGLRGSIGRDPHAGMLARLRAQSDTAISEGRGISLAHLALSYLLTGEQSYFDGISEWIHSDKMPDPLNVYAGKALHNVAVAYDWLHDELDADTLQLARETLEQGGRTLHHRLGLNTGFPAQTLTQNHFAPALLGLTSVGAALYGDAVDMAPLVRCAVEKARNSVAALGPDGASAEGHAYGQAYDGYLIHALILIRDLAGVDLFRDCAYLRNVPLFYLYSSTPRNHWRIEVGPRPACMIIFADGVRYTWYGPDAHLYALASVYRDSGAQWLATTLAQKGAASGSSLPALVTYDATVATEAPDRLPRLHHFSDKGIVFMRSGWDGEESVCGFICGPAQGRHALDNYTGEICGGHMNPNAGSFQLFAHGERLVSGDGYFFKRTEYQNTLLVNGIGQTGDNSEWFESLTQRREKSAPRILRAESVDGMDIVIGDATAAYRPEAGLKKFVRHIYRVSNSCWIVADEIEAHDPSILEILFHSDLEWQASDAANIWSVCGKRGAMRLSVLMPSSVDTVSEMQPMEYVDGKVTRNCPLLRIKNSSKLDSALFLTVIETYTAGTAPPEAPALDGGAGEPELNLQIDGANRSYKIRIEREHPAETLIL